MGDDTTTAETQLSATDTASDYHSDTVSALFYRETPRYREALGRPWGRIADADARRYMQEFVSTVDDYCAANDLTLTADSIVEHDRFPYIRFRTVETLDDTAAPVVSGQVQYYRGERLHPRLPRPHGRDCIDVGVRYQSATDATGLDGLDELLAAETALEPL